MKKLYQIILTLIVPWALSPLFLAGQNNCLEFDGADDYVNCNTINLSGLEITLECWVNVDAFQASSPYISQIIGSESSGNSAFLRFGDSGLDNNKLQFVLYIGSDQVKLDGTTALNTDTWYHIAGVYNSSSGGMKIYINGILDASNGESAAFTSNSTFYMATNDGSGRYLDGTIDEVRVWNDARTETEIRQNMYRELPDPSDASLVAYYPFNTDLSDASSNNYNGSINGGSAAYYTSSAMFGPKNCLNFNGDDYVQIGSNFSLGTNTMCVECCVYIPTSSEKGTFINVGGGGNGYAIGVGSGTFDSDGNELIYIDDAVAWHSSGVNIGTGWHHVAFTTDNSNSTNIYLDGISVLNFTSAPVTPDNTTYIGAHSSSGGRILSNGKIDEVRIWSTVRSATEIRENMYRCITGNENGLVGYYPFNTISGETLQDFSGNENGGTVYGPGGSVEDYSGTIDEIGSSSMIKDFSASWPIDGYIGYTLQLNGDANQEYLITDNNPVAVYVNGTFNPMPNVGNPFKILHYPYTASAGDWESSSAFNTWLNTSSNSWTTGSNWSDGAAPTSSDNVGIPNYSGGSQPTLDAVLACNNLVVGDDATLTDNFSGDHTIHGSAFVIGTSDIKSGNLLTVTKSLYILPLSTLNVNAGGKLTVGNKLEVLLTGTLTIKSTASATGSLIVNGTSTGNITMQRYMNNADWGDWEDGWHFLSAPVTGQGISTNFTTDPYDFYCWYELTNEWVNYKNQSTTTPYWPTANVLSNGLTENTANFLVGKGYMAAYDDAGTKSFEGSLNLDDVTISGLSITPSGTNRSWHLLGNPYSSGLTWDDTWTTSNISGTIEIWNEDGQSYSALTSGNTIPATNGFMVQVNSGTGSLTIPHSKCTHGGTFYKAAVFPSIKLKAVNLDFPSFQETQVLFNPLSTEGYEMEYDGDFLPGYAPYFYSKIDDQPMAVNSMPQLRESTAIPLTFIKNEGVNFSIEMYAAELVPLDIWLLDTKTNLDQNLTNNPIYTFSATDGDDPNRFLLHFKAVGIDEPPASGQSLPIVVWNYEYLLTISNPEQLTGTIMVYDMTGKCVLTDILENTTKQTITHALKTGLYVVRVEAENKASNQKIMINTSKGGF
ncbi:MAG: T9SS type A sorting domain-containing protein [Bacteroidales bacterium]|nr:T9SS type A sorting domain-containing protein [Bacteroidales bacterium]